MKKTTKAFDEGMEKLATKTDLNHDGHGDDRLFLGDERISVFANLMTESEYEKMEEEINKASIVRKHYEVYAWNDSSGFEYWSEGGETGDSNYIQITATINDPSKVDPDQLKADMMKLHNKLSHWDNGNEWYNWRADKEERKVR